MTRQTKAYIALVFICIAWGTTFLAIRVGVQHYPAFLFGGMRQLIGGLILMPIALMFSRKVDFSAKNLKLQVIIGFLMLTLGNGCVTWAEKYVPSGIAALLCSMMPIFAVLFNLMSSKRDHFNLTIGIGMLMGVLGVSLIFRDNISDLTRPEYLGGIFCIFIATASWAFGSTINKKAADQINPLFNSGLQLSFGGLMMLMISPAVDSYAGFELWNKEGVLSLFYLVIFGSVLSYAAYKYVLDILPVGIATIYAYINPLIAVIAGYLILDEALNIYIGLAFIAIVTSVFFVRRGYNQQKDEVVVKPPEVAKA